MNLEVMDMKSKASFFNRHIIIEDLKRFWGIGALYTLMLCLAGVFPILMVYDTLAEYGRYEIRSFLENETFFCYLFLMSAPLAAAVLIFRYMQQNHSTAVVHAFPFTRKQLFINHCISGAILILIPIVVNSLILLLIKKPVYTNDIIPVDIFSTSAIGNWALQSTLIVLVGFSIAVFAGIISGSSILQTIFGFGFLFIAPAAILLFVTYFEKFLFGFITDSKFDQIVLNISPIIAKMDSRENFCESKCIIWYLVLTLIMFVISYVLYTRRHLERATEPIAFDWLKPIFKFSLAFCGMTVLGLYFMELGENQEFGMYLGFFIGSLVSYIIAEMIVQKSLWVFKNLKGYLVFLVIAALFIVSIQTDVFGFEKRLPDISKVESIYIGSTSYRMERDLKLLTSAENIEQGYLYHQSIIDNKKILEEEINDYYNSVCIAYYYPDGKKLVRQYNLPREFVSHNPYMKEIYESEEYKQKIEPIFNIDINNIDFLDINPEFDLNNQPIHIMDREEILGFWTALQEDIADKTYEENYDTLQDLARVDIIWKKSREEMSEEDSSYDSYYYSPTIMQSYTATIEWLKEHGYMEKITVTSEDVSYITVTKYIPGNDNVITEKIEYQDDPSVIPEATKDMMVITDKDYIQTILSTLEKSYYHKKGGYNLTITFNKTGENRSNSCGGNYQLDTAPEFIKDYFN